MEECHVHRSAGVSSRHHQFFQAPPSVQHLPQRRLVRLHHAHAMHHQFSTCLNVASCDCTMLMLCFVADCTIPARPHGSKQSARRSQSSSTGTCSTAACTMLPCALRQPTSCYHATMQQLYDPRAELPHLTTPSNPHTLTAPILHCIRLQANLCRP